MRAFNETMLLRGFSDWVLDKFGNAPIRIQGLGFHENCQPTNLGILHNVNAEVDAERTTFFRYDGTGIKATKKLHDQIGQALTRAGFQRPRIDTAGLAGLLRTIEATGDFVEIVAETSCMANGSLHFLLDLLQDRSRLYLTAVTLRELQDLSGSEPHVALAANRLKESPPPGVIVDELPLDDVALMLSRAGVKKTGAKSSESDTLILRVARQKILARVRGVHSLFVVTDTALARRATTELPAGSVLAMDHRHAKPGRTYFPCEWLPLNGHGRRATVADAGRLLWELLPHFASLEIEVGQEIYQLRAHRPGGKMWPSDYDKPWVKVTVITKPAVDITTETPTPPPNPQSTDLALDGLLLFDSVESTEIPEIDSELRIPFGHFFDALMEVVRNGALEPVTAEGWPRSARRPLLTLCSGLGLIAPGEPSRLEELRACFAANDREALAAFLRPWTLFRQIAFEGATSSKNKNAFTKTVSIAEALGFVYEHQWAGANPTLEKVRTALLTHVDQIGSTTLTVESLLLDVFLKRLNVGPARTISAWSRMKAHGVFAGFELREGGTPREPDHEVIELNETNYAWSPVSLDMVDGVRDMVWKD